MEKEHDKNTQEAIFQSVYETKGTLNILRKELKNYFNSLNIYLIVIIILLAILAFK